jgi:hypothetical protein
MRICFTFHGVRHCFDVPLLIDKNVLHVPPPQNFPELELAVTVLELVNHVKGQVRDTPLTKALTQASSQFIQQVKQELPQGVELHE